MTSTTANPFEISADAVLDHRSLERLRTRLPLRGRVDVRWRGTTVVLSGKVASWYDKQISQEAARRFPGVGRVLNLLVVEPARVTVEGVAPVDSLDPVRLDAV
jgi:hypothetical protein